MVIEVANKEIGDFKGFMQKYYDEMKKNNKELGAVTGVIAEIINDNFVRNLLKISKQAKYDSLRKEYLSSLSGLIHQDSLHSKRVMTELLGKTLAKGFAFGALLKSMYDDLQNAGLPEETAKTGAVVAVGGLLAGMFGAGIVGSGLAIGLAGLLGYYMNDIYDKYVGLVEEFFDYFISSFPNIFKFTNSISPEIRKLFDEAEIARSPLVLDLDGDGVETVGKANGVYFDHDGNGFAENTGWINEDDGLLVRDVNGNGQIDDGTELFGDNSVLSNGAKADNGFEALKDLDSNIDGVFDANDAAWSEVKVWRDLDSDAKLSIINF